MIKSFRELTVYQKAFEQAMRVFVSKLTDADAEATETLIWLDFSVRCGYIDARAHTEFAAEYDQIGKMLGSMISAPEKFCYASKKARALQAGTTGKSNSHRTRH